LIAAPFRQWYEAHYGQTLSRRRQTKAGAEKEEEKKKSRSVEKKQAARVAATGKLRLLWRSSSRLVVCTPSSPRDPARVVDAMDTFWRVRVGFYQRAIRK